MIGLGKTLGLLYINVLLKQ